MYGKVNSCCTRCLWSKNSGHSNGREMKGFWRHDRQFLRLTLNTIKGYIKIKRGFFLIEYFIAQ